MNKKILSIFLSVVMLLSAFSALPVTVADLEDDIGASIELGVGWLATCPWPGPVPPADGGWGGPGEWERTAMTAFALIKLQDRAYELGYESPFDPAYEHSEIIIDGWCYIFSYGVPQAMTLQDHTAGYSGTMDDPDADGDGWGVYFHSQLGWHPTYTTGVVLMALEASGTPGRITAYDFDGDGLPDSFFDVAQDASDWLSFAQTDSGPGEGGWIYDAADNSGVQSDNSNGGYAVLGLAAAEGMGCIVPDWVKTELDSYIDYIQNDPGTSDDGVESDPDGGSGYLIPSDWVNVLKTGNLLFQMTFVGDDPSTTRFQYAMDYIIRHWQDMGGSPNDPGWGYSTDPAKYQAMYCLMKGFEYSGIDLIDLDGDDVPEHDWYAEFAQVIVDQQYGLGYWMDDSWANDIVDTCWALLTLERVAPPPPVTPWGMKEDVREILVSHFGLYDKHIEHDIQQAIWHIDKSMNPGLWVDDSHLVWQHGNKVFDEEKLAVKELLHIVEWKKAPQAAIDTAYEVIWILVESDEKLATIEYDEALPYAGTHKQVDHQLELALEEFANAADELTTIKKGHPKYDDAINAFNKAWQHAGLAIQHATK